jgi:hypothetical protein
LLLLALGFADELLADEGFVAARFFVAALRGAEAVFARVAFARAEAVFFPAFLLVADLPADDLLTAIYASRCTITIDPRSP